MDQQNNSGGQVTYDLWNQYMEDTYINEEDKRRSADALNKLTVSSMNNSIALFLREYRAYSDRAGMPLDKLDIGAVTRLWHYLPHPLKVQITNTGKKMESFFGVPFSNLSTALQTQRLYRLVIMFR